MAAPDDRVSAELVDAMNAVFGVHRGFRAAHAKGICCTGEFTATKEASHYTVAAHMSGHRVPVTARFSHGSGVPKVHDGEAGSRGMAVRFHLGNNGATDLLAVTNSLFPARKPEHFIELLTALVPDPTTHKPDLVKIEAKIKAFKVKHPELSNAVDSLLGAPPVPSYAQVVYHALHAFRFTNAARKDHYVRYVWRPEAGVATISQEKADDMPPDFLQADLRKRLREGIEFNLQLQLAVDGNDVDDPSTAWPDTNPTVHAGTMRLNRLIEDQRHGCEALVFDPTRVTDGIACSNDPILRARSGAYAVSFKRRTTP